MGDAPKPLSNRRNEDNSGEILDGKPIVSSPDALPVLEPSEHPLDDVSAPVCDAVERIDDGTGGSARENGFFFGHVGHRLMRRSCRRLTTSAAHLKSATLSDPSRESTLAVTS